MLSDLYMSKEVQQYLGCFSKEWLSDVIQHASVQLFRQLVKAHFVDDTTKPVFSLSVMLCRLNDPKMSEAERQSKESERADRSLFVQELLLSTLMQEESSSSDEDERGEIADFGAMGCVDIMPLDVALENLNLKESNKGNEPPPPPL